MTTEATPAANPANPPVTKEQRAAATRRIPMSIPTRKLEVPEIPGYHCHWFVDGNVPRALQGGYVPVTDDEVPVNQFGIATASEISGNANLGSSIKIVAGEGSTGKDAQYLNLMKIKLEWWLEDQKILEERNNRVLEAIFKGEQVGDKAVDQSQKYVKTADSKALFQRPTRKSTQ